MDLNNDILREMEAENVCAPKMAFDKLFAIKQEISKEEFLRKLFCYLAANSFIRVENVSFGKVKERTAEIMSCTAKVKGTAYIGSISTRRIQGSSYPTYMKTSYAGSTLYEPLNKDSFSPKPITYIKDFFNGITMYRPFGVDDVVPKPVTYREYDFEGRMFFQPMDAENIMPKPPTYKKITTHTGSTIYEPVNTEGITPKPVTYIERTSPTGATLYEPFNVDETIRERKERKSTFHETPATCICYNNDAAVSSSNLDAAIQTAKDISLIQNGDVIVSANALAYAMERCKDIAKSVRFKEHEDVRCETEAIINELVCYYAPVYEVTYTYQGKEYAASILACGNTEVECEMPTEEIIIDASPKSKEAYSVVLFWGTYALAALLCIFQVGWLWPVPLACLIYTLYQGYTKQKHIEQEIGIHRIKAVLKNNNWAGLSKEEETKIQSFITSHWPQKTSYTPQIVAMIALFVFSAIAGLG